MREEILDLKKRAKPMPLHVHLGQDSNVVTVILPTTFNIIHYPSIGSMHGKFIHIYIISIFAIYCNSFDLIPGVAIAIQPVMNPRIELLFRAQLEER